ncbi:multidrug RND transporter [Neomicrococcus aestuarii]|uniref:Multidrug RND transporter n=2 Tax=Neomicrococcus aestuarii TaxID=556325 RepID=A0A1L2ZN28_9MICC|nr:MMPL family transporter [Neomicrococcus aestuarii]APF40441.1 multidrug RND transporter [Neomicrococcus aestuarii]
MASFLYRLGKFSYRHRWLVVSMWLVALLAIGGSAAAFMGKLSNEFSIPGTETQRTLDKLEQEMPEFAGGNGRIVFETANGQSFTSTQEKAVEDAVKQLDELTFVRTAMDPFSTQEQLDSAAQKVADGQKELDAARKKLEDGRAQLADGKQQLADGQKKIDDGQAQLEDATQQWKSGTQQLADARAQLAEGQKELDAARAQLKSGQEAFAAGEKKIADGQAQYDAGLAKVRDGEKQLAAAQKTLSSKEADWLAGQQKYEAGVESLTSGLGVSSLSQVSSAIDDAKSQLSSAKKQVADGQAQIDAAKKDLAAKSSEVSKQDSTLKASLDKVNSGLAQLQQQEEAVKADTSLSAAEKEAALAEIAAQRTTLNGQKAQIEAGLDQIADAKEQIAAANDQIAAKQAEIDAAQEKISASASKLAAATSGYQQLLGAKSTLDSGRKQLDQAKSTLATKQQELEDGKAELATAKSTLDAGKAELEANRVKLEEGAAKIASGAATLAEGEKLLAANQAKADAGAEKIADSQQQLADGQTTLNEKAAEIPKAEEEIADGAEKIETGEADLALGQRQAESTAGMRFVSSDGTLAASQLTFTSSADALTSADRSQIQEIANVVEADGVNVYYSKEIVSDLNSIFGTAEVLGLLIAAVVLFVMLGTLVAAGLPLLMAVLGVAAGVGGTLAFSSLISMASITPALALMLGLAVGIDYSLFIVHRHRRQLLSGMDMEESIGRATGTSGNAVVFAGLTVVIALAALAVPGLPFLAILGISAAATVAIAVLIALTLTPAMLGIIGNRLISKRAWAKAARAEETPAHAEQQATGNRGWGALVTRFPWVALGLGAILLALLAIPATSMRTALPDGSAEPAGSSAFLAYEKLGDSFGDGYNGPMLVVADLPSGLDDRAAEIQTLDVADQIRSIPGVVAAVPAGTNDAKTIGIIQVIPEAGPSSAETEELVHTIRDQASQIEEATGSHIALAGQVAAQIDVSERLNEVLPLYLGIVVGLSLVLLLLVFRSVVIPVLATAGFLLSLAAAFGATVAVYQWGWLGNIFDVNVPGPIMSFMPILLTGILFGLAMDYQVFLVSGMRESYAHGQDARLAVRTGFVHSAPVVTAAALIMTSVFAGFIFSHLTMIRAIGFSLAIGVLLDAFVVRMTLTPAIMHLLGERAWYIPRWLDRILPDVDVEGAKLEQEREAKAAPMHTVTQEQDTIHV